MTGKDQAKKAADCALAMQASMVGLNQKWSTENIPELKMRIGIGNPSGGGNLRLCGALGLHRHRSDRQHGGRIESACAPGDVFISGELCDLLPEKWRRRRAHTRLKESTEPRDFTSLSVIQPKRSSLPVLRN